MSGILYLVATPIGNLTELSERTISTLKSVDIVACENPKNSGILLAHLGIQKKTIQVNAVNEAKTSENIIKLIMDGANIAFVSDAGYPCISDPGYLLVTQAIKKDIEMHVINGSSAFLTALVASGLDATKFFFYGFLSSKSGTKKNELTTLKSLQNTIIFYESSHRIQDTMKVMYEVFGDRKVCVARELTKIHEEYMRGKLSELQELSLNQQKGEFVIILEGASSVCSLSENELLDQMNLLVAQGYKIKEASEDLGKKHNVSKNYLYNLYHKNKE
ncbi:MAG: 16S rRNA (cytidine(1402)-2'-O)-methyltransferase [Bacilli bacterium]